MSSEPKDSEYREVELRPRPRSYDFDLVTRDGEVVGQVISSALGFTVYRIGDLEALLGAYETAEEAHEAFHRWSRDASESPAQQDAQAAPAPK